MGCRGSEVFVDDWDVWLRECLMSSNEALGERWLDVYLTSPACRFVCAAGTCGPQPVIGLMVPSVDGRTLFPLTLWRTCLLSQPDYGDHRICGFSIARSADHRHLAMEEIDFETFDAQVVQLGETLESIAVPPASCSIRRGALDGGAQPAIPLDPRPISRWPSSSCWRSGCRRHDPVVW